jgi:hypothetical protein
MLDFYCSYLIAAFGVSLSNFDLGILELSDTGDTDSLCTLDFVSKVSF